MVRIILGTFHAAGKRNKKTLLLSADYMSAADVTLLQ